jgi:hypothetical protein
VLALIHTAHFIPFSEHNPCKQMILKGAAHAALLQNRVRGMPSVLKSEQSFLRNDNVMLNEEVFAE